MVFNVYLRKCWLLLLFLMLAGNTSILVAADNLNPFIYAGDISGSLQQASSEVKSKIKASAFELVHEYQPNDNSAVFIISSKDLRAEAAKSEHGGFAGVQRLSLVKAGNKYQFSYTNPVFMQHAYLMDKSDLSSYLDKMKTAFGYKEEFGATNMTASKLKRYKYSFGLEKFTDFYELKSYGSSAEAIKELEKGFTVAENGVKKLFTMKFEGKDITLIGVKLDAVGSGEEWLDENKMLEIIDHKDPRRVAYLPYEILVMDGKYYVMAARFRIALYFSDLPMFGPNGFGKLFNVPNAYAKAFTMVTGGEVSKAQTPGGFGGLP